MGAAGGKGEYIGGTEAVSSRRQWLRLVDNDVCAPAQRPPFGFRVSKATVGRVAEQTCVFEEKRVHLNAYLVRNDTGIESRNAPAVTRFVRRCW
jgi:hypothetical protein